MDNSPIYYHAVGNLGITESYWNLLTYVNLDNYAQQTKAIEKGIESLFQECEKLFTTSSVCKHFVSHTNTIMHQIKINWQRVLASIHKSHQIRRRRGLINIVGRTANVLFGTCDDTDAEKFYAQINEFNRYKLSSTHIMESQTTIVRNTVNDINDTLHEVVKQSERWEQRQNQTIQMLYNVSGTVDELITHERISDLQSDIIILINLLSLEVENLVDIVNFATQGRIHSSILSPKTIIDQMSSIKSKLQADAKFPMELTTNSISDLFKIATITVISLDNTLIFSIEIPITNGMEFIAYEVIPLPMAINENQAVILDTKASHIAVDKSHRNFISFGENEFKQCETLKDLYLCPNDHAVNFDNIMQNCEQAIFNNFNTIPNSCNKKFLHSLPTIWHKLSGENAWLFVVCNETVIIPCDNESQPTQIHLNNAGKISLNEKCKIYTKNSKLSPTRKYKSKILIDFHPNVILNVTLDNLKNIRLSNRLGNTNNRETNYNFKSLAKDADDLKALQEKIKLELDREDNDNKNTHITTTIIIITTIMLILSICSCIIIMYKRMSMFSCKPEGTESSKSPQPIALTTINKEAVPTASARQGTRAKSPLPEIV